MKEIYLNNQAPKLYKLKLKLETAAVGVNLHSLMVRFSFMRDCGSIPHGDSTVSMFHSIFRQRVLLKKIQILSTELLQLNISLWSNGKILPKTF